MGAHKLGEEYEYPVIFELNKIRIKWEQSVQPVLSTTRTVVLEQKDDAPYSDDGRKDKKMKKEKKKKKDKDKDKEKKSKKTKKKERSRSYDRSESRDNHDSRRTRTNRDSPPRHRSRTPPRKERNRERSEEQISRRRRTRSRERQSDNRRGDRSRSRDYERGKRNRSRDSRRNTPPDMRQATNGDYNPLALLGSSLRKDGPDDKRDSGSKRSRFDSPPKSTPSGSGGGGGVDLRARLSRTNHRAEEKAKRVERAKDSINQYQSNQMDQHQGRFPDRGNFNQRGRRGGYNQGSHYNQGYGHQQQHQGYNQPYNNHHHQQQQQQLPGINPMVMMTQM